jgi:hypothetical protein
MRRGQILARAAHAPRFARDRSLGASELDAYVDDSLSNPADANLPLIDPFREKLAAH